MEGVEFLLWLVLVLLALLAGAVLYLLASRRHYQRVDYSHLVEQEGRGKRMQARLDRLEQLLGDLAEYDRRRREELDAFAAAARESLAEQVRHAREDIVSEVLSNPAAWDRLLLDHSDAGISAQARERIAPAPSAEEHLEPWRQLPQGPRQQRISELLERGHSAQEISRLLGVSGHEVELVATFVFREREA